MRSIVLATSNIGKVKEIKPVLEEHGFHVIIQTELSVSDVPETGLSFVENALIKARHAAKSTGLPALADDSGLEVLTLNGAPGIYSARYAGEKATPEQNIKKLLSKMSGNADRKAFFHCAMVYLQNAHDATPLICQTKWEGDILFEPQGTKGFSYDPIFYVPTHQCSAAELTLQQKNIISHRGKALAKMIQLLSLSKI